MCRYGNREVFHGKCLNCRRRLRIIITNDATEWWAGNCVCGYRNEYTINETLDGFEQKIERIK